MDADDPGALAAVVRKRSDVLEAVDERPHRKRDLVEVLGVSRSTVDRALRELARHGLVERTDEGVVATTAGRLAAAERRAFERRLAAVDEAGTLLAHVPADWTPGADLLADATVETPAPREPTAPLERVKTLLADADRYRGVSPAVTDVSFAGLFRERAAAGLDIEFVFSRPMADHLWRTHAETVRELMTEHGFRAFERESVPFGLALDPGERACLVVYEPDSTLAGVVDSDAPGFVEWAGDRYRRLRASATERSPPRVAERTASDTERSHEPPP